MIKLAFLCRNFSDNLCVLYAENNTPLIWYTAKSLMFSKVSELLEIFSIMHEHY